MISQLKYVQLTRQMTNEGPNLLKRCFTIPSVLLCCIGLLGIYSVSIQALSQDIRYISDMQYVPLRSGPGTQYRIINKGLPSGTRLTLLRSSDDQLYSEVSTGRGTTGWVRSQYLMSEIPSRNKVADANARAAAATGESKVLANRLSSLGAERDALAQQLAQTGTDLEAMGKQYAQLESVSSNAIQLDSDNQRLVQDSEILRAKLDTLQAENQRLQDKLSSEAFFNGALAVLLGVVITLVVPRLWPKRKNNSSWA